jgi:hypothetical protein
MEALRANLAALAAANMQRQMQKQQAERETAEQELNMTDGAVVCLVLLGENNALKKFGVEVQRELVQAGWHTETHFLDRRKVGKVLDTAAIAGYRYALLLGDSSLKDKTVKVRDFGAPGFRAANHMTPTEVVAYVNGREGPNSPLKLAPAKIKEVLEMSSERERTRRRRTREEEEHTRDEERDAKRRAPNRDREPPQPQPCTLPRTHIHVRTQMFSHRPRTFCLAASNGWVTSGPGTPTTRLSMQT